MADIFFPPTTPTEIGLFFVRSYYQIFASQRGYMFHFYKEDSSMMRIDGDVTESALDLADIRKIIMSLKFTYIKINTINSLKSLSGGILVVVSGIVKSRDFCRKFGQTFFLAPQMNGYYLLNDVFHLADDDVLQQNPALLSQKQSVDYHPASSTHFSYQIESHDALGEVARDYPNIVNIGGNEPFKKYASQKHHQLGPKPEPLTDSVAKPAPEPGVEGQEKGTYFEEPISLPQSAISTVEENQPFEEEHDGQPKITTYASILCAKGKSASSIRSTVFSQNAPHASDWSFASQPLVGHNASPVQVIRREADTEVRRPSSGVLHSGRSGRIARGGRYGRFSGRGT